MGSLDIGFIKSVDLNLQIVNKPNQQLVAYY